MGGEKVWVSPDVDTLRANPASNLVEAQALAAGNLAGVIGDYSSAANAVQLTPIPGINNTYVALNTPGDFSSGRIENWVLPQFVSQANGLPSFGFSVRLYDGDPNSGGSEVLTTDGTTGTGVNKTVAWIFDYASGILLTSDTSSLFSSNPYITGFTYIGTTANDSSGSTPGEGSGFIEHDASCPSDAQIDDFVYITGPSVGGLLQVAPVDVYNIATLPAAGIIIEKSSPTNCVVRVAGEVIPGAVLTPGKRYYVGVDSQPSLAMPSPGPGERCGAQQAAYALDTNRLMLTFQQVPIVRVGS